MHVLIILVIVGFAFVTVGANFPKVTPYPAAQPTEVTVNFSAHSAQDGTNTLQLRTFAAEIQPVVPTPSCQVNGNAEVMLVIDYSGSVKGEVIQKEKEAAKVFVDTLARNPQNRVGIVTFSQEATLVSGLTGDFAGLKRKIDSLPQGKGSTCMKCGVEMANNEIAQKGRAGISKAIVLLSDGRANVPQPKTAAEKATVDAVTFGYNQHKTVLHTVGFSSAISGGLTMIIGVNDVNEVFMRQLASLTNGKYYYSPTQNDLATIFRELGVQLICQQGQPATFAAPTAPPASPSPTSQPVPTITR